MRALAISLMLLAAPAAAQTADGAAIYKRCASCHLATGAGVPGAFPPLTSEPAMLAAKPDGRRFLVLAVTRGLSGPIMVEGKRYSGVMPAQSGLDDASVAAVINHVLDTIAKAPQKRKPKQKQKQKQKQSRKEGRRPFLPTFRENVCSTSPG